jgi:hypothetical protein
LIIYFNKIIIEIYQFQELNALNFNLEHIFKTVFQKCITKKIDIDFNLDYIAELRIFQYIGFKISEIF